MDEAWSVGNVEAPREERNAGGGVGRFLRRHHVVIVHEPEFVSVHRRSVALHFLSLGIVNP